MEKVIRDFKSLIVQDCPRNLAKTLNELIASEVCDTEQVIALCQRAFELGTSQDEGELILLAWQVLLKFLPQESDELANGYENSTSYMWLGRQRARLIHDRLGPGEMMELPVQLLKLMQTKTSNRLMFATVLEIVERLVTLSVPVELRALGDIVGNALWQQDELILHKARSLIVCLFRRMRNLDDPLWLDLSKMLQDIDPETKVRYLLMKDLLEARIKVEGFTDSVLIKLLLRTLEGQKALAPAISDCIVMLLVVRPEEQPELTLAIAECSDELGLLGQYLFPRLVKKLPETAVKLLDELGTLALRSDEFRDFGFTKSTVRCIKGLLTRRISGRVPYHPSRWT